MKLFFVKLDNLEISDHMFLIVIVAKEKYI